MAEYGDEVEPALHTHERQSHQKRDGERDSSSRKGPEPAAEQPPPCDYCHRRPQEHRQADRDTGHGTVQVPPRNRGAERYDEADVAQVQVLERGRRQTRQREHAQPDVSRRRHHDERPYEQDEPDGQPEHDRHVERYVGEREQRDREWR
jgi:hypothetical protein